MNAIAESCQTLKLSTLEYHVSINDDQTVDQNATLGDIFDITPSLTDLFLSLPESVDTLGLWRKLEGNRLPIRRFLYHQRAAVVEDGHYQRDNDAAVDLTDMSLLPEHQSELERADEQHPFARMNLESLGLGASPYILVCPLTVVLLRLKYG